MKFQSFLVQFFPVVLPSILVSNIVIKNVLLFSQAVDVY